MIYLHIFDSVLILFGAVKNLILTQPAITCSKLTLETPEQGVKFVQS